MAYISDPKEARALIADWKAHLAKPAREHCGIGRRSWRRTVEHAVGHLRGILAEGLRYGPSGSNRRRRDRVPPSVRGGA